MHRHLLKFGSPIYFLRLTHCAIFSVSALFTRCLIFTRVCPAVSTALYAFSLRFPLYAPRLDRPHCILSCRPNVPTRLQLSLSAGIVNQQVKECKKTREWLLRCLLNQQAIKETPKAKWRQL